MSQLSEILLSLSLDVVEMVHIIHRLSSVIELLDVTLYVNVKNDLQQMDLEIVFQMVYVELQILLSTILVLVRIHLRIIILLHIVLMEVFLHYKKQTEYILGIVH